MPPYESVMIAVSTSVAAASGAKLRTTMPAMSESAWTIATVKTGTSVIRMRGVPRLMRAGEQPRPPLQTG